MPFINTTTNVSVSPEKEVGKYRFEQAGVDVEPEEEDEEIDMEDLLNDLDDDDVPF